MSESVFLLKDFQALGTVWYVEVFENLSEEKKILVQKRLQETILSFESRYSRFKKDSLLSSLNRDRKVSYDEHLAKMLIEADMLSKNTEGVFDVFIHNTLSQKGYGAHDEGVTQCEGVTHAVINETLIELFGGESVDLGGIGKGYLIDLLSNILQKTFSIEGYLINGGGDMYVTSNHGEDVELFLQHPTQKDIVIGSVFLKNKAFCCSSSYVRSWNYKGDQKNHFVSKGGDEVWAASYVVGDTAMTADSMATVLCLTSKNKNFSFELAKKYNLSFMVYDDVFDGFGTLQIQQVS